MKKQIPNFITLMNLFCGVLAVLAIMEYHNITLAAIFVVMGIIFDFFDGFMARLLKVSSPLGLQLDSLADMVTAGLVPSLVMYNMLQNSSYILSSDGDFVNFLPYFGLLIALASAYRLAKFNIDTRQTHGFIGLPTPANALFILSIQLIVIYQPVGLEALLQNTWFLLMVTVLSCYLLNADIYLFALKFKNFSFKDNKIRFLFLAISIILLLLLKFIAIPLVIGIYILLSVIIRERGDKI